MLKIKDFKECLNLTVVVASLGYFVDLFDITLFGVVRVVSLKDLGIMDPQQILSSGVYIYNAGMIGMMIGGVLWGILADKKGRLSVLFASILLYSISNIANAFVWDVHSYAFFRFLGGLGLAGELGAAITLVAESLPREKRGVGTTIVATCGMLGIVAAAFIGQVLPWKASYFLGGVLGLGLLFTRFRLKESFLFSENNGAESNTRGNVLLLLKPKLLLKYLSCIAIGVPIYFTTGILFTFAPELTSGLHVQGTVTAGNAILLGSIGLTIGDLLSGILSQLLKSRKKSIGLSLLAAFVFMGLYTLTINPSSTFIYTICLVMGVSVGYWAMLVTTAAEQFGTNIRATVATTVPNFVRGSAIFATSAFAFIKNVIPVPQAAFAIGMICFALAFAGLWNISETFSEDLNYLEGE